MATYTFVEATEYNFPHITVYRKLRDGVQSAWRFNTEDGYVMYDTRANDTELDPETMEERPVTYYYVVASAPLSFNMDNFPWVAVPRESVDENYIFGLPTNPPEVM